MLKEFFDHLSRIDSFFWGYVAFLLIVVLGCYLTIQGRFFQIRALPSIFKIFFHYLSQSPSDARGVHPLKAFFASAGGMIGIGNVVGIVTAVQIGGPGALLWVWSVAIVGTIIKYSEISLGIKHRVKNDLEDMMVDRCFFFDMLLTIVVFQFLSPFFCVFMEWISISLPS